MTAPGPPTSPSAPPPGSTVVGADGDLVGRVAAVTTPTSGTHPTSDAAAWVTLTLAGTTTAVLAPLASAHRTTDGIAVAVDAATVRGAPRLADPSIVPAERDRAAARSYYRRHTGAEHSATPGGPPHPELATGDQALGDQTSDDGVAATPDATTIRSREDLVVRTEWVPYRRMRLRKRVVTEERTITVTVRREELVIDDSDIDPDDAVPDAERPHHGPGGVPVPENGVIEMTLHAEEPVVSTRVVAVERVRARVVVVDGHPAVVTDNVRHEKVDIEPH